MFDKKEQKNTNNPLPKEWTEEKIEMNFSTIPDVFYGGIEPKVEFRQVAQKEIKEQKTKMVEKPKQPEMVQPKKVVTPAKQPLKSSKLKIPKKKKSILWIILIAIGATITIVLISWYYLNQAGYFNDAQENENLQEENIDIKNPVQVPMEVLEDTSTTTPTTTQQDEISVPSSLQEAALEFPEINFRNTEDIDEDNLTDLEEEVFSTDSGIWDSDQDGYYDGQELVNLYNPKGFAPIRVIDSGLVREYVNPVWKYRVYYPVVWEASSVDTTSKQILISSATGEYVEIRVLEKEKIQTFLSWFGEKAIGQNSTDLSEFVNRFEQDGYRRADNLVAYFTQGESVFVVTYHHNNTDEPVKYRHIMEMMIQSFRYGNSIDIDITQQPLVGFGDS